MDKSVRASGADAGDVRVVIDQPSRIDVSKRAP